MTTGTTDTPDAEVNVFAVELRRWRDVRGHSRATLAKAMGYDRSYVSKVESGAERPSEAFAAHAETALRTGGALRTAFRDYEKDRPARPRAPAPSEIMSALGIVQDSDLALRRVARLLELPAEAEDARRVVTALNSAAERVAQVHTFGKGMGIAAPQIGIDRAVAIVRTPDGEAITLFNPNIIEQAGDVDDQYEGCLSFFDVRGQVPRSHVIHVEHTTIDGAKKITVFERGVARLIAHEIDHLHGHLYTDRMRDCVEPIPVEQYRGTGTSWKY